MASALALSYPLPLSEIQPPSISSGFSTIQGNSLIGNNEPFVPEIHNSYATILGKDPSCPILLQCKEYVKSRGLQLPQGNAEDLLPDSNIPIVGGGVLLSIGRWGHIAYLEEVLPNSIYICESNYAGCGIVSCRWLDISDSTIRGYIMP